MREASVSSSRSRVKRTLLTIDVVAAKRSPGARLAIDGDIAPYRSFGSPFSETSLYQFRVMPFSVNYDISPTCQALAII